VEGRGGGGGMCVVCAEGKSLYTSHDVCVCVCVCVSACKCPNSTHHRCARASRLIASHHACPATPPLTRSNGLHMATAALRGVASPSSPKYLQMSQGFKVRVRVRVRVGVPRLFRGICACSVGLTYKVLRLRVGQGTCVPRALHFLWNLTSWTGIYRHTAPPPMSPRHSPAEDVGSQRPATGKEQARGVTVADVGDNTPEVLQWRGRGRTREACGCRATGFNQRQAFNSMLLKKTRKTPPGLPSLSGSDRRKKQKPSSECQCRLSALANTEAAGTRSPL
jgi:hypothetical protein